MQVTDDDGGKVSIVLVYAYAKQTSVPHKSDSQFMTREQMYTQRN